MKMKNILIAVFALSLTVVSLSSCGNNSGNAAEEAWQHERDSLTRVNGQQQAVLDQMTAAMAEIAFCLDTIAVHEKVIIVGIDEEGNRLSRKGIRNRLEILAQVISEQKEKLGVLEEKFSNSTLQIGKLHSIIEFLENSLSQKDAEVERLKAEVNSRNFSVAALEEKVSLMSDTISEERATNTVQKQQIAKQDALLNEVYYVIGNDDQLVSNGILKKEGKILKKKKVDFSNINKSSLTKGDIRTLKAISIRGKSPKILSDVPKGAYSLDKNSDDSYTLRITDPNSFWSANNRILIIQIKK